MMEAEHGGLRAAPRSRCGAAGAPSDPNAGPDRLPQRQDRGRAPAGPACGRPRDHGPEWETGAQEDWLGGWAMNLMLINVLTCRFGRAVRLPEGDAPAPPGSGVRSRRPRGGS